MYTENYKTLMRAIKEDLNKWMKNFFFKLIYCG